MAKSKKPTTTVEETPVVTSVEELTAPSTQEIKYNISYEVVGSYKKKVTGTCLHNADMQVFIIEDVNGGIVFLPVRNLLYIDMRPVK